jgi:hypothetical protein
MHDLNKPNSLLRILNIETKHHTGDMAQMVERLFSKWEKPKKKKKHILMSTMIIQMIATPVHLENEHCHLFIQGL